LENYESDSLVEADEVTDVEAGVDPAAGIAKFRRRTRLTVAKNSASADAAAISAVKAAKQKKKKKKRMMMMMMMMMMKRKRRAASPLVVATPTILAPCSREVRSEDEEEEEKEKDEVVEELSVPEDQAARSSESPTAKRQRELVQKTSEEALRRGLEAQCCGGAGKDTCGH
jgi:hypothetical protein